MIACFLSSSTSGPKKNKLGKYKYLRICPEFDGLLLPKTEEGPQAHGHGEKQESKDGLPCPLLKDQKLKRKPAKFIVLPWSRPFDKNDT